MFSALCRQPTKDVEAQFLLAGSGPVPKPLQQVDVWKASKTWISAFEFDPYLLYLRADGKPLSHSQTRAVYMALLTLWNRNQIILTIDAGTAIIIANPVQTGPKTPINRIKDILANWIIAHVSRNRTAEQQKRALESNTKTAKVQNEVLGDRVKEMLYVGLVATDPQSQGHGYGGALLDTITSMADALGQASWLHSSSVINDGFYNSHGFETVGKIYLGDDNPEWHQEPVLLQIMVREPRNKPEVSPTEKHLKSYFVNPLPPFSFLV
ncbi:hypothetical protein BDZ97DRAFT_246528 [Flammula alnicola]|nr:hypothetical protein BDZ97DRAFT_246528 [Flammula alnicola]